MARRAQEFIPELRPGFLVKPGIAGVRAQVIDSRGNFIKEAVELEGLCSYQITNYNSPGATGSPAYAAWLVAKLDGAGYFDHLDQASSPVKSIWDFKTVRDVIGT